MFKLNSDNLVLIIERLNDDRKSLTSCLFVNKLWCQTSLRILWKDPWNLFLNEDNLDKAKPFFRTILSQLPESSRKLLTGKNIKIEYQKPLFDYVSHLRFIKHTYSADGKKDNDIYDYVFKEYNEHQKIELKKEIYKYFFKKCSSLTFIDLTNFKYKLHDFPDVGQNLSKLNYLRFDDKTIQLINDLSEICKSVEKLDINLTCSNPTGLSKFIQIQPYLKLLIIRDNVNENNNTSLESKYGTVGDAIAEKQDINYLDLTIENNVSFYNILLTKLANLQKLVLADSRYRNVTVHKQLKFGNYPKLQVLKISISYSVAVKIIQATKDTIQVIWLDKGNQESEDQISQLLRSISEHCRKLKYLKTYLKDENLEDFKQLLLNCKDLEGLYIFRASIYNDEDGKKLLDVLADSAQDKLYKFQLHYCYFNINTLDNFFKKWKGKKGRKPLYLYPILANYYENRHLSREEFNKNKKRFNDIIEKYKKEKTIRLFENSKDFTFINEFVF
ncbi:hypothetical protein RclHR1_01110023 [Rhizophagus clarus]|uniref:F-box domain-containing protein n=1 Tax=Rhizophagus clarus TaxID=94130 RepID=A0A2Z6QV41_9GLOM|nr:hypothetical protein RclHR1_01110023 [Rhizophagus clarus]GES74563.1 hypothetical protein GLOIN_2v1530019 [Rhizophagus clarus]